MRPSRGAPVVPLLLPCMHMDTVSKWLIPINIYRYAYCIIFNVSPCLRLLSDSFWGSLPLRPECSGGTLAPLPIAPDGPTPESPELNVYECNVCGGRRTEAQFLQEIDDVSHHQATEL